MPYRRDPVGAADRSRRVIGRDARGAAARRAGDDHPPLPVLGSLDRCWCGHPTGHDWPDREGGAPHPD